MEGFSSLPDLSEYLKDVNDDELCNLDSKEEIVQVINADVSKLFPILVQLLRKNVTFKVFLEYCRWIILGGEPMKQLLDHYNTVSRTQKIIKIHKYENNPM